MSKQKKKHKKQPKVLKLSPEQVAEVLRELKAAQVSDKVTELFKTVIHGNEWLFDQIEKGLLTIAKLRKIFDIKTEAANRNPRRNKPEAKKQKIKGHGRNDADAYEGAQVVNVLHQELKPGDDCPDEYCDGKLYEMSEPGVFIQVVGSPLATATRYNLQKLRCALCQNIYQASLPEGVSNKKYDENFVAMLMINKYFVSVPFYRQDRLQNYLGIPLPSSTQWDLMYEHKPMLKALYETLLIDAANGIGISYDDTSVKILSEIQAKKRAEKGEKKKHNCFTTGIVAAYEDHRTYVFMSDNRTAGQIIIDMLKTYRDKDKDPPILMCDALTANVPQEIADDLYILCYCLVHARRQFYELPNGYDDLADGVIRLIGKVYDNESWAKQLSAEERLKYHQKHSKPYMNELKEFLETRQSEFEPNSIAGKAIEYVLKRWTELSQFLRYAHAPIDNNITERALKLVIQTRKSSLFYKTLEGARFASYVQSALYSAAQNNINPCSYMAALLENEAAVIEKPQDWLPWIYKDTIKQIQEVDAKKATLPQGSLDSG
ncbi:MAG: IS66 family transposase [Bacteroidales bacterium]